MHPGQKITLTADASDPDGRVVSIDWENSPTVEVPEGDGRKTVSVIAIDNDGGEAVQSITIKNHGIESNSLAESSAIHTVYCYYNDKPERTRQAPDHCEIVDANNSPDNDGYQSDSSNVDRMLQSPKYNIIWKKTSREVSQHSGNLADEVGTVMPDVVDNDGMSVTVPCLDASQRKALRGDSVEIISNSFSLDGKTVMNDLTGDGDVNAGDWDERFDSPSSTAMDNHVGAVHELKDSRLADRQARGSEGADAGGSSSDSSAASDSPWRNDSAHDAGESSGDTSESGDTETTSGEVAADKGRRLVNGGGMGGAVLVPRSTVAMNCLAVETAEANVALGVPSNGWRSLEKP